MTTDEATPDPPPEAGDLRKPDIETAENGTPEPGGYAGAFYMTTPAGSIERVKSPEAAAAIRGVLVEAMENVRAGRPLPFAFAEVAPEVARDFPGVAQAAWAKRSRVFYVAGRVTPEGPSFTLAGFSLAEGPMTLPQANLIADALLGFLADGQASGRVVLGSA